MAPVSSAKSAYTIKKKALTRHIERTTPWLNDPNVELHRLEEARGVCKATWDAFSAAHEKLMEILSEDEAQQAEMEAREQEVGEPHRYCCYTIPNQCQQVWPLQV